MGEELGLPKLAVRRKQRRYDVAKKISDGQFFVPKKEHARLNLNVLPIRPPWSNNSKVQSTFFFRTLFEIAHDINVDLGHNWEISPIRRHPP